jgi:hypothetical protein
MEMDMDMDMIIDMNLGVDMEIGMDIENAALALIRAAEGHIFHPKL